jgi:hypothetical protein
MNVMNDWINPLFLCEVLMNAEDVDEVNGANFDSLFNFSDLSLANVCSFITLSSQPLRYSVIIDINWSKGLSWNDVQIGLGNKFLFSQTKNSIFS